MFRDSVQALPVHRTLQLHVYIYIYANERGSPSNFPKPYEPSSRKTDILTSENNPIPLNSGSGLKWVLTLNLQAAA